MKKYVVMLILSFTIMIALMGAVQYFMAKESAQTELLAKAHRDLEESKRVDAVQAEVESALRNVMSGVIESIPHPDSFFAFSSQLVKNNPHIVGAGIAFRPNYYSSFGKGRLYAPYAFDQNPDLNMKKKSTTPNIQARLLGQDYTQLEWYAKAMTEGKSLWTEPYVDQNGTKIIMCTYAQPIKAKNGHTIGVIFADVPMEDVSLLSMNINSGISKNSRILLVIQLISLLIVLLIAWVAVKASQRYKNEKIDAERELLIAEIERLKAKNLRLTQRNIDLGKMINDKEQKQQQQQQRQHPLGGLLRFLTNK